MFIFHFPISYFLTFSALVECVLTFHALIMILSLCRQNICHMRLSLTFEESVKKDWPYSCFYLIILRCALQLLFLGGMVKWFPTAFFMVISSRHYFKFYYQWLLECISPLITLIFLLAGLLINLFIHNEVG